MSSPRRRCRSALLSAAGPAGPAGDRTSRRGRGRGTRSELAPLSWRSPRQRSPECWSRWGGGRSRTDPREVYRSPGADVRRAAPAWLFPNLATASPRRNLSGRGGLCPAPLSRGATHLSHLVPSKKAFFPLKG